MKPNKLKVEEKVGKKEGGTFTFTLTKEEDGYNSELKGDGIDAMIVIGNMVMAILSLAKDIERRNLMGGLDKMFRSALDKKGKGK